jgi:hypothetical protein
MSLQNRKARLDKDREEMKDKILKILDIDIKNKDKNSLILYELDKNIQLQEIILSLENECKEKFRCSNWTFFVYKREGKTSDRLYLILLKNILSECNIEYVNTQLYIYDNDQKHKTIKYVFI